MSMALGAFLAGLVVGPIRIQRARGVRRAADARCLRRPVLRLRRHAARSRAPARATGDDRARPWRHPDRQAAGGACVIVALFRLSAEGGTVRRGRAGADRRVLVHRGRAREPARRAHAGRDEHPDRRRRSSRSPSTRCCSARSPRWSAGSRAGREPAAGRSAITGRTLPRCDTARSSWATGRSAEP